MKRTSVGRTYARPRSASRWMCLAAVIAGMVCIAPADAAEYELRLAPYDDLNATVAQRVNQQTTWTQYFYTLSESQREGYIGPYACWARNVLVDGKKTFEIYERGNFIARFPVVTIPLAPGKHTIWPGDHVFTIAKDGTVKSDDPDLVISTDNKTKGGVKHVIKIKCYPVTIRAKDADPMAPEPSELIEEIILPDLTIREAADNDRVQAAHKAAIAKAIEEGKIKKGTRTSQFPPPPATELLPQINRFRFLIAWLPANTVGKGYAIYPLSHTFHLGAKGIISGAGKGGEKVKSWKTKGYEITIPSVRIPIVAKPGTQVLITDLQALRFPLRNTMYERKGILRHGTATPYTRPEPWEIRTTPAGPSLLLNGNLSDLPNKQMLVDWHSPKQLYDRVLLVETETRHMKVGQVFRARVRGLDPAEGDAAAQAAEEVEAAIEPIKARIPRLEGAIRAARAQLVRVNPPVGVMDRARKQVDAAAKALATLKAKPKKNPAQIAAATKKLAAARTALTKAVAAVKVARKKGDKKIQAAEAKEAAAKTALAKGQADLRAAEAKAVTFRKAAAAAMNKNLLATGKPFAKLQAHGSFKWLDLPLKASADGTVKITLPTVRNGVYKLKLGLQPTTPGAQSFSVDQWVSVAAGGGNGIGVFTQRGRTAFYRGETFWLGVGVVAALKPMPVGTDVTVDFIDADGARIPMYRAKTGQEIRDRHTFILDVASATTLALAPGYYVVDAKVGGLAGPPFQVEIVDPAPLTHFVNLLNGKYNLWGNAHYSGVLGGREEANPAGRGIAASGYNVFMGMSYGMNRVQWPGRTIVAELVRARPELGPWEAYAPPSGRDQFLNAMVRYKLGFYENLFTQHDSMMPRGEKILNACERYSTLEAQSMRHSPAFLGVCIFDEFSRSLDHDTGADMIAYFHRADELEYRRKYKRGSSQALRDRDRFLGRPEGQRDYKDIESYRTWPEHLDNQWAGFCGRMSKAVKNVMPEALNYTYHRIDALPGSTMGSEELGRNLDALATVGYKDMGGFGAYATAGPLATDVMRSRDDLLVWPQLYGLGTGPHGASNMRQAFFTLSQKPDGITFFQFESSLKSTLTDNFNGIRDITAMTTRYGDLILAAKRGYKKVAIFYSREMDMISGTKKITEGIWTACIRAGFPSDILHDKQIRADKGLEYEVIFVPGFTTKDAVPPKTMAALKRLLSAGKTIVIGTKSRLGLAGKGVVRLETNFDEIDGGETFAKHLDFDDERWWKRTEETTKIIRTFLAKRIEPAARHDLLVGPDWLRCRKGEYMIIPNFARTEFKGNHKTLYVAPDSPTISFPKRPPVCYDMLEMRRGNTTTTDGWTTLKVDMRYYPGKMYAFLPAAIESVTLRAPASINAGAKLSYEIFVTDAQNKMIDAGIPLEITITAPSGKVLQQVYRAGAPKFGGAYIVPVNVGAGSLKVRARELISGRLVEASIPVKAGTIQPATLDNRPVRITDIDRIRRFMVEDVKIAEPRWTETDVLDAGRLGLLFRDGRGELEKHIKSKLSKETLKLIDAYDSKEKDKGKGKGKGEGTSLAKLLVADLNKLISSGEPIYTDERFPPGKLSIATGRVGQESRKIKDAKDLTGVNRQMIEEWYVGEFTRSAPIYIGIEAPWAVKQAERLGKVLRDQGWRVRVTSMQPYVRGPAPIRAAGGKAGELILDGSRLWRGTVVSPGVFVDAPLILLGRRQGMVDHLINRDLLAEPVSENFPGAGKAILGWVHKAFSNHFDTLVVLASDEAGLTRGVDALLNIKDPKLVSRRVHPIAKEPSFDAAAALKDYSGKQLARSSYRADLRLEDRVQTLNVDPKTGRVLIGTFGFGHNLFCFDKAGKLLWKTFLPEHDVYMARWYDDGKKVLASTGQGFFIFLIDGGTGKVFRKFASTEWPNFHVAEREINTRVAVTLNPKLRQMIIRGATGILALNYEGKRMWFYDRARDIVDYPAKAEQGAYAAFGEYLQLSGVVPSPDGTRIAYNERRHFETTMGFAGPVPLWRNEPQILDAKTGKVLLKNIDDPGSNDLWRLTWPANSKTPWIHASNLWAPLRFTGRKAGGVDVGAIGERKAPIRAQLKIGGLLEMDSQYTARVAPSGKDIWRVRDENVWILSTFSTWGSIAGPGNSGNINPVNAKDDRLYRSSRDGLVRCFDLKTGKTIWQYQLPCVTLLLPVGNNEVVAGARNGTIVRFSAAGKVLWETSLRDHHQIPKGHYPDYLAKAKDRDPDSTRDFYPVFSDTPDDFKGVLNMGIEQLANGGFESATGLNTDRGWRVEGGKVQVDAKAPHAGKQSLRLTQGQLATCTVQRKIIPSATYLLEFYYRIDSAGARLAAGARLSGASGKAPVLTVSNFTAAAGKWTFGRVAIKTWAGTKVVDVGFEAGDGQVSVDSVRLRPIRFPSANLLANAALHKVEVTHPTDHRILYPRIPPSMSQDLLTSNNVTAFLQATPLGALIFTQEQAFLHNGKIDDIGTMWCYRPDRIGFGVVLTEPAYVSHLVIYLNNTMPDTVYENIVILANDLELKVPQTVGFIRGNRRRFIVVHFPETLFTDNLKVLPGKYRTQTDSITEIEVYGPIGGPDMLRNKRFAKDKVSGAVPMFMSSPSHVQKVLPDDLVGKYTETLRKYQQVAPALHSGVTAADGAMTFAYATGAIVNVPLTEEKKEFRKKLDATQAVRDARFAAQEAGTLFFHGWEIGSVTPTTTVARYAGRLLAGSADYKMHAVADNGAHIWGFQTEGRVYSSPAPRKDDVYFGSDDGRLYKVDVDSGILIWEFPTGGRVRSSPALGTTNVYAASWDGLLYAVNMNSGRLAWKAKIGRYSSSSPALFGGRIYIGDEDGKLHCFSASNGKPVWAKPPEIGGRISMCPVVTTDGIFVSGENSAAALVGTNGTIRWKRRLLAKARKPGQMPARVTGQPLATKTQLIVPTARGVLVLKRLTGVPDPRFVAPTMVGTDGKKITMNREYCVSAVPYDKRLCIVINGTEYQGVLGRFIVANKGASLVWEPEVPAKKK